jgi:hypothetical protein
MQMDCRTGLGLDQQVVGAGVGEGGEMALRLDDHQMDVERRCRRGADGLKLDWPATRYSTCRPLSITG